MKRTITLLLIAVGGLLLLSGCFKFTFQKPEDERALKVLLTDAVIPLEDVEKLEVTIESITLHGPAEDTQSEVLVISQESTTVELLSLIGEEIELANVEGFGFYNQLRMEISAATLTANGEVFPVIVNSSSLKINNLNIDLNEETVLLLDFDLAKSLKYNGKWEELFQGKGNREDRVRLTPVIHVRNGSLYDVSGTATATTDFSTLLAILVPESGGDTLATFTHKATPNWEFGEFRFCKVYPGVYTLKFFDDYTAENFDPNTSVPLYELPERIVVSDGDVELGEIVVK